RTLVFFRIGRVDGDTKQFTKNVKLDLSVVVGHMTSFWCTSSESSCEERGTTLHDITASISLSLSLSLSLARSLSLAHCLSCGLLCVIAFACRCRQFAHSLS
ncbi:hypothetical protein GOP47_0026062, partial [Adiantum capillus-veneris]